MVFYKRVSMASSALILSGLASSASYAEDIVDMSLRDLMDLQVFTSATRVPTQLTKAPGTVFRFSRQDFARFGARNVTDLLEFVPGVQINQYRKRHRSIWVRGLLDRYNSKMVLEVDGVRTRSLYYNHFSLDDAFPLEQIESVEVVLGPVSSLYGANAFAGIISIKTRDFSADSKLQMTAEVGDHERRKVSGLYNSEKFQAFGSYLEQDAPFREDRKSFIGSDVLQPLDEDYQSLQLKLRPLDGLTLKLDYKKSEVPFLFIPPTQDGFIEEESTQFTAAYEVGSLESGRLEVHAYHNNLNAHEHEVEQETRQLGYLEHQDATMAGASALFLRRFSEHTLAGGVVWEREAADNTSYTRYYYFADGFLDPPEQGNLLSEPDFEADNLAAYAQDVWVLPSKLELTLGVRYDDFEHYGDHLNYRAALVYEPSERHTGKLMYGTAIRTPNLRESLKVLEGNTFVPPELEPEEINSLELAYLYQLDWANVSVTLFHNELDNYIREVPSPEDEYFANISETVTFDGVESVVNLRPHEALDIRFGVSYLNTEDPDGYDLPYLSEWNSNLKFEYRLSERHTLGAAFIYGSDREDLNFFDDDDADAFVITNIFASGQISKGLSYSLGVDNLFDERIYDPAADFGGQHNTERAEREVWAQLAWTLDL
ncbi:TonB-dependent receptor [Halioglobus maricola]|uniref:TonB-dependent receptor n=1 Tax=Halioglobus maricola TaxID=2601894 RepID=A0A5P9NGZ3_9GAMM|nr:TonB-dependent receptor [Halioglobus maricola]QFU74298.1 TonB-dependent receptor [Halioglobus maricola]